MPPGQSDETFGAAGISRTLIPEHVTHIHGMDVQADGKIILVGSAVEGDTQRALVLRLNSDGNLDTDFGSNGIVLYGPPVFYRGGDYVARFAKALPNGHIIVAGDVEDSLFTLRLLSNGAFDSTYKSDLRIVDPHVTAAGLGVQSTGHVVVTCETVERTGSKDRNIYVYRFLPDGKPDFNFGRTQLGNSRDDYASSMLLLSDDRILVGGSRENDTQGVVYRVNADGSEGLPIYLSPIYQSIKQRVRSLSLDPDNNILVLYSFDSENHSFGLQRLSSQWIADTFFAEKVGQINLSGNTSSPLSVSVQPDRRIVVFGPEKAEEETTHFSLHRFEWDGSIDTGFGQNGVLELPVGESGITGAAMKIVDNKIVLAGNTPDDQGPVVARLHVGDLRTESPITITEQPQGQTLVQKEIIHLSVKATGPEGMVYTWFRDSVMVRRSLNPNWSFYAFTGKEAGTYRVEVRYAGTAVLSEAAEVIVQMPPRIDSDYYVSSFVGQPAFLRFWIGGRPPFTVHWFKDDVEFRTETSSSGEVSINFPSFTEDDVGAYHIVVTNDEGTLTSRIYRLGLLVDPSIILLHEPGGAVVNQGEDFVLRAHIDSSLTTYKAQWFNGAKAVSSAKTAPFTLRNMGFKDAGMYTLKVTSAVGKATSPKIPVSVADTSGHKHVAVLGERFTITVPVKDHGIRYQWYREDTLLEDNDILSGTQTASLRFTSVTPSDAGNYACHLQQGGTDLLTNPQVLEVVTERPEVGEITLPVAQIGSPYEAPLPLPSRAAALEIKGLPAGFLYQADKGILYGTPVKAGTFKLTLTAINSLGRSSPVQTMLVISPFPSDRTGRYYGNFSHDLAEGTLDMTVSAKGTYTGKMTLCTKLGKTGNIAFKGAFRNHETVTPSQPEPPHIDAVALPPSVLAPIIGQPTLTLTLEDTVIHASASFLLDREGEEQEKNFTITCHSCPWSTQNPVSEALPGNYNLSWSNNRGDLAGYGFSRATLKAAGIFSHSGKLTDGTSFTQSAPLTEEYSYNGFTPLYSSRGGLACSFTFELGSHAPSSYFDTLLYGDLHWSKYLEDPKGQKVYPYHFEANPGIMTGTKYLPPKTEGLTGSLVMNAIAGDANIQMDIFDMTTINGTLVSNQRIDLSGHEEGNEIIGLKSLSFNAATGIFTGRGSFTTEEEFYVPRLDEYITKEVQKSYQVHGIIVRAHDSLNGEAVGFGLIPYYNVYDQRYNMTRAAPLTIIPRR